MQVSIGIFLGYDKIRSGQAVAVAVVLVLITRGFPLTSIARHDVFYAKIAPKNSVSAALQPHKLI